MPSGTLFVPVKAAESLLTSPPSTWLLRFPLPVLKRLEGGSAPTPVASTRAPPGSLAPDAAMFLISTLAKPPKSENEKSSTWSSWYDTPTAHSPPGHGSPTNSATPLVCRVWVSPSRVRVTPPSTWHSVVRPKIADAKASDSFADAFARQTGAWPGTLVAVTWPFCGSKLLQSAARSSPKQCVRQSPTALSRSAWAWHVQRMRSAKHWRAICSRFCSTRTWQSACTAVAAGTKSGGRLGLIAGFRSSGKQTLLLRSNDCPPPLQVQSQVYASGGARSVGVIPKIWLQPALSVAIHTSPTGTRRPRARSRRRPPAGERRCRASAKRFHR